MWLAILGVFKSRSEDYKVRKSLLFRRFPGKVLYLCLPLTFFCPEEPAEREQVCFAGPKGLMEFIHVTLEQK